MAPPRAVKPAPLLPPKFGTVICGLDLFEDSGVAADYAARLAALLGARLVLAHASSRAIAPISIVTSPDVHERSLERASPARADDDQGRLVLVHELDEPGGRLADLHPVGDGVLGQGASGESAGERLASALARGPTLTFGDLVVSVRKDQAPSFGRSREAAVDADAH